MGTGSFPRVNLPGSIVDQLPHLATTVKKELSYNSTTLLGVRSLFYGDLYLYISFENWVL